MDIELNDTVLQQGTEEEQNEEKNINLGQHIYKETVATTVSSTELGIYDKNLKDIIHDIFLAYENNILAKVTPEETKQLLADWFSGKIHDNDDKPQLYEQSVTSVTSDAEQQVRQLLKRQRVDSSV